MLLKGAVKFSLIVRPRGNNVSSFYLLCLCVLSLAAMLKKWCKYWTGQRVRMGWGANGQSYLVALNLYRWRRSVFLKKFNLELARLISL